jgi:hypothetical protein
MLLYLMSMLQQVHRGPRDLVFGHGYLPPVTLANAMNSFSFDNDTGTSNIFRYMPDHYTYSFKPTSSFSDEIFFPSQDTVLGSRLRLLKLKASVDCRPHLMGIIEPLQCMDGEIAWLWPCYHVDWAWWLVWILLMDIFFRRPVIHLLTVRFRFSLAILGPEEQSKNIATAHGQRAAR